MNKCLLVLSCVVLCIGVAGAQLQRQSSSSTLQGGGGEGLQNKPTASQTGGRNKGMKPNDEGEMEFADSSNGKSMTIGLRRVCLLNGTKDFVCGNANPRRSCFDFDGKNPQNKNVTRESVVTEESNNQQQNVEQDLKGGKTDSRISVSGSLSGSKQTTRLSSGSMVCEMESIIKSDTADTTITIGNSSITMKEGDMKMVIQCENVTVRPQCANADATFIRFYVRVQSGSDSAGAQPQARQTGSTGRVRSGNSLELQQGSDGFVANVLPTGIIDDGNLKVEDIDVQSSTWMEKDQNQNNRQVPGFIADMKVLRNAMGIKYKLDPTVGSASAVYVSSLLLALTVLLHAMF